jgi:hypothetical protein
MVNSGIETESETETAAVETASIEICLARWEKSSH